MYVYTYIHMCVHVYWLSLADVYGCAEITTCPLLTRDLPIEYPSMRECIIWECVHSHILGVQVYGSASSYLGRPSSWVMRPHVLGVPHYTGIGIHTDTNIRFAESSSVHCESSTIVSWGFLHFAGTPPEQGKGWCNTSVSQSGPATSLS